MNLGIVDLPNTRASVVAGCFLLWNLRLPVNSRLVQEGILTSTVQEPHNNTAFGESLVFDALLIFGFGVSLITFAMFITAVPDVIIKSSSADLSLWQTLSI